MSLGSSNRDGGKTSESGHLRALYKAFGSGVISGLNVTQRAAGANMSVDVAIGDAIIGRSDATYGHPAWADATYNVAVTAADVSNPRRDIVVMYIDYAVTPSTAVSNNTNNVVKIAVVAGTPAGSPSDPSSAAIQSAIGSGNPWIYLARVRVGAGATSVSTSVIDDLRTLINPRLETSQITQNTETRFDYVASGLVWTGDAYASTRNASMTAGVVYINGRRISLSAVTARSFTASKDTYVDVLDNLDGTGTLVYTEVTNNAASPALAANSLRIGIVVTGASNIAAAGSINQGQPGALLPIASSQQYEVTDSLGNLICPRDPARQVIGYRQAVTAQTGITTLVDLTGLSCPVIVPTGRKIAVTAYSLAQSSVADDDINTEIREGATTLQVFRTLARPASANMIANPKVVLLPTAGLHTYKASMQRILGTGTVQSGASTSSPTFILVELL